MEQEPRVLGHPGYFEELGPRFIRDCCRNDRFVDLDGSHHAGPNAVSVGAGGNQDDRVDDGQHDNGHRDGERHAYREKTQCSCEAARARGHE